MKKGIAVFGALVTCPCHIPLWTGILAGTALGTVLVHYRSVVVLVAALLFTVFLTAALAGRGAEGWHEDG